MELHWILGARICVHVNRALGGLRSSLTRRSLKQLNGRPCRYEQKQPLGSDSFHDDMLPSSNSERCEPAEEAYAHQASGHRSSAANAALTAAGGSARRPSEQALVSADLCSRRWRPDGGTARRSHWHTISECPPSRASPPGRPHPLRLQMTARRRLRQPPPPVYRGR
jgi:hypothetical protein